MKRYEFHVRNNLTPEELKALKAVSDPPYRVYVIEAESIDEAWGKYKMRVTKPWDSVELVNPPELDGNKFMSLSKPDERAAKLRRLSR